MRRIGIVFLVMVLAAPIVHAQGSAYNEIGFGTPVRAGNAIEDALGGTGVVLDGNRIVNDLNPADWSWITRARFDASFRYNYYSATQGTLNDVQKSFLFSGVSFGAPIYSAWSASLALGYVPLTDASDQIDSGAKTYYSKGGTNLAFIGVSARPISGVAIGARLDYLTGNIRHMGQLTPADTEAGTGNFEADYFYRGVRPTLGFQIIGDSIGMSGLSLGATYSPATSLTSTYETITTPISSSLDTTIDVSGVGRYPAALSAGIGYRLSRRYRAEADYFLQDFSSAYVYSPKAISGDLNLGASTRFALGIERKPNLNGEYGTSFGFDRWAVRLGLSYATLPFYFNGSGVHEFSLSGGFGIPVSLETVLNLSIVAGQRIPITAGSAPKETFVRLGADISFSEQWFVPAPKKDQ